MNLIESSLNNRLKRVVLDSQNSSWTPVSAGIPQGSGPLFFLICSNDLAEGISSTTKLIPDGTSLFSVVSNINRSANQMNMNLEKYHSGLISGRCLSILKS